MAGADIIALIILGAIVIAVVVYLLHWLYRRSSKDISFVRTGLGGEKVVMGGGALVLPIVHDITEVSMNTLRLEIRRAREQSLITKDRMRVEVAVEFYVRVMPEDDAVAAAARTLGHRTMNPDSLKDLVQGRFVDALGAVAAEMTMEHMHEKRGEYVRAVKARVADALTQNGLELEAVSLTNLDQTDIQLFNPSNAFDAEGLTWLTEQIESRKKKRNDIEQDTRIQIRNKNLESERQSLEIDRETEYARLEQEREVAMRRAQQRAEVAREKVDREREIEEFEIRAREEIEKTRIGQERTLDGERILREQETERLEVVRRRVLALEEQDRAIAIAEKSKAQSEAEAAAEGARSKSVEATERVVSMRETVIAERRKQIELIDAAQKAEREALTMKVIAEAEKIAANDRAEADKFATMAAKFRYEIEAAGKRALNEAENLRSDASRRSALRIRLVDNLEAIIRESVKPMERIESIKVLHVDGLPGLSGTYPPGVAGDGHPAGGRGDGDRGGRNLTENIVNSALRYRAQAPFVDTLLKEIGMSSTEIASLGGLLGSEQEEPKPDDTKRTKGKS